MSVMTASVGDLPSSTSGSNDQHAIPVAEEAVALANGFSVGLHGQFFARKGADEHDERGLRQVEIRQQSVGDFELETGMDENIRAAACSDDTTMVAGDRFQGAHGGGAFSGKDPSKVDRSAAYATRHIAKNLVAAGVCDEVLVQVAYAIGVAKPVGLYVNTYGSAKVKMTDGEISKKIEKVFDMRPYFIEDRFKLRTPIYSETAAYGHMGRESKVVEKIFNKGKKTEKRVKVELFPWEKLDYVEQLKKAFKL
jgi:hypothetical protein